RYEEYKGLYNYGINSLLRVGRSFLEKDYHEEVTDLVNADLVIGTYEAIDIHLRSKGRRAFGEIHTVVIDEVQMLNDEDRGWVLDGLIARLRFLYPTAQYLFLSATVSDPRLLADHYSCRLIEFKGRPVPVERHLILTLNEFDKKKIMLKLAYKEFLLKSSFNYKGQTLIFTNSRKKCHSLAEFLSKNSVYSQAYHGGLTLSERRKVEFLFSNQKISTVVTTAALAAGVDFPASQVIFESLAMGIEWISVAEFEQMSGRAGRYKKHDRAKVVILCEPGKTYHGGQIEPEEKIAMSVLKGKIEPIVLEPNEDRMYTELLAFISMLSNKNLARSSNSGPNHNELIKFHENMLNNDFFLKSGLNYLTKNNFVEYGTMRPNGTIEIYATRYGKACAQSFYTLKKCIKIRESLETNEDLFNEAMFVPTSEDLEDLDAPADNIKGDKDDAPLNTFQDNVPVMIALELNPFKNIYLNKSISKEIKPKSRKSKGSTLFFSNSTYFLLSAESLGKKRSLSNKMKNLLIIWTKEIFNCRCENRPDCNCGRRNVEAKIIELKSQGRNLFEISKFLHRRWKIKIYMGDLIDYIDTVLHNLRSIYKIGRTLKLSKSSRENVDYVYDLIYLLEH
ncbi:MAG: DEAD/DEAH box helicase, partial [Candidatus Lokiarchaeota archaeon]|nr:DEAD/DEAH box helicase [Candidatus Lokiarchaeota archaeon]